MKKLLRYYSWLDRIGKGCTFVEASAKKLQEDYMAYLNESPPSVVNRWAGGDLIKGKDNTATYYPSDGGKPEILKADTNLLDLYNRNEGIRKTWDSAYGPSCLKESCPFATQSPVVLKNFVIQDKTISQLRDSKFIDTAPCVYRYYRDSHFQVLYLIAYEISLQFPDRKAQKLSLLDAGDISGSCPDHSTHNGMDCLALDIHYYTLGDTNRTQWGNDRVNIWNEDGSLNSMFDAERQATLVTLIAEAFPMTSDGQHGDCVMKVHSKIRAAMLKFAANDPVMTKAIKWATVDEDTPKYNHHTHMHTFFGDAINYDMVV